ncbi:MAG: 16S rRNA (guanine(966)-N(2))-methyltransferase RsmD [Oscillatoriales cyanobacterium SM2_2_1]|nr:16S rRNA (guanine(966)-N(2))-methyltransferase RsmD [Oscillatoriales cyanobacterium SM2_2_1]
MAIRLRRDRPALRVPEGLGIRPTPSKVRAAVTNIWQWQIPGASWLDLCTGAGAMGAEALLRGVGRVVGIEVSAAACRLIHQHWGAIASPDQQFAALRLEVRQGIRWLHQRQEVFDLVYFDPPYDSDLYEPVLALLPLVLAPTAQVAVEHNKQRTLPEVIGGLRLGDRRIYGQTAVSFFELSDEPEFEQLPGQQD